MKSMTNKSTIILVILLQFVVFGLSAGNHSRKDSVTTNVCLEVVGIALDQRDQPINGVTVTLYKENSEQEWTEVTSVTYHEHSFLFSLEANEYYTIEVSKPGFVTRSIGISTQLPTTVSLKEMFKYEFEVSLFKEKKGVDDYYLDFPVALISYDSKHDVFDNNNAYTKHIKTKIKESVNEASGLKTLANSKKSE
jgi:hypothetical protein